MRSGGLCSPSFRAVLPDSPSVGRPPSERPPSVPARGRRRKAVLTFLAGDAGGDVFCYSNADIRKGEEADEVLRFVQFWENRYGKRPRHLVFDSKLTTYANLSTLHNDWQITFVTLRRRSQTLMADVATLPPSASHTGHLAVPPREVKTTRE